MPARFGTDGVRGVANEELTAELALALGRATARVSARADLRRRPRHPPLGPPARRPPSRPGWPPRAPTWSTSACCRRPAWRRWRRRRAVPGAVDLGLAQPVRRQRHQAVLAVRDEAARRGRGRDRARARVGVLADPDRPPRRPTGLGVGRLSLDAAAGASLYVRHLVATLAGRSLDGAARSWSTAPTGRPATFAASRVRRELGASVTALHDAPDGVEHQRRVRLDRPLGAGAASWWRRGPTSGWRSTATPTG